MPPPAKVFFAGERADIDDIAGALAEHGREYGPGDKEDALEIGVEHAIPIRFRLFMGGAEETDARIIDKDGDGTECGFRARDQAENFRCHRNIRHLRENGRAEIGKKSGGVLQCR